MAGYSWVAGKSNNAVAAEDDGKLVASKFAAWVRGWKRFAGCNAGDVRRALMASEWHHSSKMFNRVEYFDPRDLLEAGNRDALARSIRFRKLFDRLVKDHGQAGRFAVKMADGGTWYMVETGEYQAHHLARMIQTVEQGFAVTDLQAQHSTLSAAGVV